MVSKLADHDVAEVYQPGCGQGAVAELAPERTQSGRPGF